MEQLAIPPSILVLVSIILAILHNKNLVSSHRFHQWKIIFYLIGIGILIKGAISLSKDYKDYYSLGIVVASSLYLLITYYFLNISYKPENVALTYNEPIEEKAMPKEELNKQVIDFMKYSNGEIRLWGGDFSFFGNLNGINKHPQYAELEERKFEKMLVLGKRPDTEPKKARFGKMLNDFKDKIEFRFYNDHKFPDLKVRGLLGREFGDKNNEIAIIYKQLKSDEYTLVGSYDDKKGGEIYIKLWGFAWSRADSITLNEKKEFLKNYQEAIKYSGHE